MKSIRSPIEIPEFRPYFACSDQFSLCQSAPPRAGEPCILEYFVPFASSCILLFPLLLAAYFAINQSALTAYRVEEQVQIDAVSLSLCHQQKNFFNTELAELNSKIEDVQDRMSATYRVCVAAMAVPHPATQVNVRNACRKLLSGFSKFGDLLLKTLKFKLYSFKTKLRLKVGPRLINENGLNKNLLVIRYPSISQGFQEQLDFEHERDERSSALVFGKTPWPRHLVGSSSFLSSHEVRLSYDFKHEYASPKLESLRTPKLSQAKCRLEEERPGRRYAVEL